MVIGQKEIRGVKCDIEADVGGRFSIKLAGGDGRSLGYSDTLEAAERQAATKIAQRKVKVDVPFFTKAGERGSATGLHAGNGNVVARVGDKTHQLTYSEVCVFSAEIPPEALERYLDIDRQVCELRREAGAIVNQWEVDLSDLVPAAIEKATTERAD